MHQSFEEGNGGALIPADRGASSGHIACWICGRRAPRAPQSQWRHATAFCDGQLVPFLCCSRACFEMAGVLLAGMRRLLLWQRGSSDNAA